MMSVVAVRKYVLKGRVFLPEAQASPWLSAGLVLAGETSARSALAKTPCMDWATPEFSGPTVPRMASSSTIDVAFCLPEDGTAWSS